MKITIQTIPHASQRYETVGDWIFDENGDLWITVSDLGDWRKSLLVGFHELIESSLCQHRHIDEPLVSAFDIAMLANPNEYADDPGHDPEAPYHSEHVFAECMERLFAQQLGVNWKEYGEAIDAL